MAATAPASAARVLWVRRGLPPWRKFVFFVFFLSPPRVPWLLFPLLPPPPPAVWAVAVECGARRAAGRRVSGQGGTGEEGQGGGVGGGWGGWG